MSTYHNLLKFLLIVLLHGISFCAFSMDPDEKRMRPEAETPGERGQGALEAELKYDEDKALFFRILWRTVNNLRVENENLIATALREHGVSLVLRETWDTNKVDSVQKLLDYLVSKVIAKQNENGNVSQRWILDERESKLLVTILTPCSKWFRTYTTYLLREVLENVELDPSTLESFAEKVVKEGYVKLTLPEGQEDTKEINANISILETWNWTPKTWSAVNNFFTMLEDANWSSSYFSLSYASTSYEEAEGILASLDFNRIEGSREDEFKFIESLIGKLSSLDQEDVRYDVLKAYLDSKPEREDYVLGMFRASVEDGEGNIPTAYLLEMFRFTKFNNDEAVKEIARIAHDSYSEMMNEAGYEVRSIARRRFRDAATDDESLCLSEDAINAVIRQVRVDQRNILIRAINHPRDEPTGIWAIDELVDLVLLGWKNPQDILGAARRIFEAE